LMAPPTMEAKDAEGQYTKAILNRRGAETQSSDAEFIKDTGGARNRFNAPGGLEGYGRGA
jgi:hypothetical protein